MSFCNVSASNVPPNLLILFRETSGLVTGSSLVLWIMPSHVNWLKECECPRSEGCRGSAPDPVHLVLLAPRKAEPKKGAPRKSLQAPLGRLPAGRQGFRGSLKLVRQGIIINYFRTSDSHCALSFSLGRGAKISEGVYNNGRIRKNILAR